MEAILNIVNQTGRINSFPHACICFLSSSVIHTWTRKVLMPSLLFLFAFHQTQVLKHFRQTLYQFSYICRPIIFLWLLFPNSNKQTNQNQNNKTKTKKPPGKPEAGSVPRGERGCWSCLSKLWKLGPTPWERNPRAQPTLQDYPPAAFSFTVLKSERSEETTFLSGTNWERLPTARGNFCLNIHLLTVFQWSRWVQAV